MRLRVPGIPRYVAALAAVVVATLCSLALEPVISRIPFSLYFAAVALAARYGGLGPGLVAAALGVLAADYFVFPPRYSLQLASLEDSIALLVLAFVAVLISSITAQLRTSREAERRQREWLETSLRSIGDAVIATDARGRVSFLNPIAEELSGWSAEQAAGRPIEEVFSIVNEQTRQSVENPVTKVLRDGAIVGLANHTVLVGRDGTERPIDDSGAPIRDEQGGIVGVVLVFRDIAERRAAEREHAALLAHAEAARAQVTATLESITDAFCALDREWRYTYVNARAARMLGRNPADLLGKILWEEFPQFAATPTAAEYQRVMDEQVAARLEYYSPILNAWLDVHLYPAQGGLSLYFQDITERRQAQEQLARHQTLLEESQRSGNIGSWEWDIADNAVTWSDELYRVYGLEPQSVPITFDRFLSLVHPDDRNTVRNAIEQSFHDGQPFGFDHRIVRPDGEVRTLRARGRVVLDEDGRPRRMIGSGQDITEQHEAEAKLRRQAELLELAHDAIIVMDLETRILFWNRGAEALYGWAREQALGRVARELLRTEFPIGFEEMLEAVVSAGSWEGELVHTARDGTVLRVTSRWALQRDERGRPGAILEINRDVTRQRQAETERASILRQFEAVVRQMPVGVVVAEASSGTALLVNDEARRITGYEFPELLEIESYTPIQGFRGLRTNGAEYPSADWPLMRELHFGEVVIGEEIELERVDGSRVPIRSNAAPIHDADGRIVAAVVAFEDISERRKLEQARQEFVSMVGHELRNPLASLRGYAQLMQRRSTYDERALEVIIGQTNQLERRITDLTDLSRLVAGRLTLTCAPIALVELVNALVEQAVVQSANHTFRVETPDRPLVGLWDRDRLGQVLANLLSNAVKYSPQGGEVIVRVEDRDEQALVSIQDRGLGIAADQLQRLFERFHRVPATAGRADGLGLGLYISKELVEAHGGRIWAESPGEGEGSTFSFSLPLTTTTESQLPPTA